MHLKQLRGILIIQISKIMSSEKLRQISQKVQNQQLDYLKAFDINQSDHIESLIQIIKSLDPIPQNIRAVKKLMLNYGLPIVIYLRQFYKMLPEKVKYQHQQELRMLAGIVNQLTCGKDIPQIKFIFQYGINKQNYRKHLLKDQIQFANFISQLTNINDKILTKKIEMNFQEYRKFIEKNIEKNQFTKLMIRSIKDYSLKAQQVQKIGNKKVQVQQKPSSSQLFQEDQNSEWSDAVSQQQLKDFYSHQVSLEKTNNTSSLSALSFSLNDSSSFIDFNQKNQNLCCRKYFIQNQVITDKQNIRTSFLQMKQPSENDFVKIQKIICSFLNCEGGKMYFGLEKSSGGKTVVKNYLYTQYQKEEIIKLFRRIVQQIQPDIVTQKLYYVQFIPIKDLTGSYIPGANVIRVTVNYGLRDQVYSYRIGQYDYFPFRNGVEIIQKHGRQLLKIYRNMIKNPLPIPQPLHSHPCKKPEVGEPLHYSTGQQFKATKKQQTKANDSFESLNNSLNSTRDITLQRQKIIQVNKIKQKSSSEVGSPKHQITKKQSNNHQLYAYFFVIGLGERHLSPVFAEKNILQNVKFDSNRENRLIVRVHGKAQTDKARKVLKKIQTKYKEKNIKVFQISLEMQIQNKIVEAIECLKSMKLHYKITGKEKNIVQFKLFRDSFQAFIQLQSKKIPIKFLNSENKPG